MTMEPSNVVPDETGLTRVPLLFNPDGKVADRLRRKIDRHPENYIRFYNRQVWLLSRSMNRNRGPAYPLIVVETIVAHVFSERNGLGYSPADWARKVLERDPKPDDRGTAAWSLGQKSRTEA